MIDDPRKADAQADDAPEARNREQDDEDAQAQSVAEAARRDRPQEDSDKASGGDSDDVQDLVDHMNQMERSGVIDMDAYRGERSDDDEDDKLGPGGIEDDEPRGAP